MTWYYNRLTGTGEPFTLNSGTWTERTCASLGAPHAVAMQANLLLLNSGLAETLAADNSNEYAARRGTGVGQSENWDALDGYETSNGWTTGGGLIETSLEMYMVKMATSTLNTVSPSAHRPFSINTDDSATINGPPYSMGAPYGGNQPDEIHFGESYYEATRLDVEEWINDINSFDASLGTRKDLSYASLETYDSGCAMFWQSDPPYLSPARGGVYSSDDIYFDFSTPSTMAVTFSAGSIVNGDLQENKNEWQLLLMYYPDAGTDWKLFPNSPHAITGTGLTVNETISDFEDSSTGVYEYVRVILQRRGDNAARQVLTIRGDIGAA